MKRMKNFIFGLAMVLAVFMWTFAYANEVSCPPPDPIPACEGCNGTGDFIIETITIIPNTTGLPFPEWGGDQVAQAKATLSGTGLSVDAKGITTGSVSGANETPQDNTISSWSTVKSTALAEGSGGPCPVKIAMAALINPVVNNWAQKILPEGTTFAGGSAGGGIDLKAMESSNGEPKKAEVSGEANSFVVASAFGPTEFFKDANVQTNVNLKGAILAGQPVNKNYYGGDKAVVQANINPNGALITGNGSYNRNWNCTNPIVADGKMNSTSSMTPLANGFSGQNITTIKLSLSPNL
jgi:hypothetical protein